MKGAPGRGDVHHWWTDGHVGVVDRRNRIVELGAFVCGQGADQLDAVTVDACAEGVVQAVGDEEDPGDHGAPCQHRREPPSMIVVDARRLGEGSAFRGVGTYVRNLLAALVELEGVLVRALATPATALPAGVVRIPLQRRGAGAS